MSLTVSVVMYCLQEPPPAGVVAAFVVLLAAAVSRSILRSRREAAELAAQQRVVMKQRAEELRAQKAVSAARATHAAGRVEPPRVCLLITVLTRHEQSAQACSLLDAWPFYRLPHLSHHPMPILPSIATKCVVYCSPSCRGSWAC